jgi:hypothetical protein
MYKAVKVPLLKRAKNPYEFTRMAKTLMAAI